MTKRFLLTAVLLLGTLLLSACGEEATGPTDDSGSATPDASDGSGDVAGERVSISGGSYTRVSATQLQAMLPNKDFSFVNTHVPSEGNIPGTDLSIPYDQIGQNLNLLPDKYAKIVLYCRSGRMSTDAAETLVGLGYTDVWELEGGMIAWEEAGLPLDGA